MNYAKHSLTLILHNSNPIEDDESVEDNKHVEDNNPIEDGEDVKDMPFNGGETSKHLDANEEEEDTSENNEKQKFMMSYNIGKKGLFHSLIPSISRTDWKLDNNNTDNSSDNGATSTPGKIEIDKDVKQPACPAIHFLLVLFIYFSIMHLFKPNPPTLMRMCSMLTI